MCIVTQRHAEFCAAKGHVSTGHHFVVCVTEGVGLHGADSGPGIFSGMICITVVDAGLAICQRDQSVRGTETRALVRIANVKLKRSPGCEAVVQLL